MMPGSPSTLIQVGPRDIWAPRVVVRESWPSLSRSTVKMSRMRTGFSMAGSWRAYSSRDLRASSRRPGRVSGVGSVASWAGQGRDQSRAQKRRTPLLRCGGTGADMRGIVWRQKDGGNDHTGRAGGDCDREARAGRPCHVAGGQLDSGRSAGRIGGNERTGGLSGGSAVDGDGAVHVLVRHPPALGWGVSVDVVAGRAGA